MERGGLNIGIFDLYNELTHGYEILFIYFCQLALKREEILQKQEEEVRAKRKYVYKKEPEDDAPKAYKKGIGKYINPTAL